MGERVDVIIKGSVMEIDAITAIDTILNLMSGRNLVKADACGPNCLSLVFQRGNGDVMDYQIEGLPPRLVEEAVKMQSLL